MFRPPYHGTLYRPKRKENTMHNPLTTQQVHALIDITAIVLRSEARAAIPSPEEVTDTLDRVIANFQNDFGHIEPDQYKDARDVLYSRLIPSTLPRGNPVGA